MSRRFLSATLALAILAPSLAHARSAADEQDLVRARALDKQGVVAYREERYNDAIRYFEEAFRLGGPSSELWNIAKCHAKLDAPEEEKKAIERYLSQPNLSAGDRAEAQRELDELHRKPSTLTVASSPEGATVYLDGRHPAGVTPLSIPVTPGTHTVSIEHAGYEPYSEKIHPEMGRVVIVDARLSPNGDATPPTRETRDDGKRGSLVPPPGAPHPHHLVILGELGASVPLHGAVGGSPSPAAILGLEYIVHDSGRAVWGIGARATLLVDSWGNSTGTPNTSATCGTTIADSETATALSAFLDGSFAHRIGQRWRIGGDLGVGIATYSVDQVGGDLFLPTCRPSIGPRPAVHLGGQASYALGRDFRLVMAPVIEANGAFDGARATPKDASGLWLRFGAFFGIALDAF